jgi:hypothetical protein
MTARKKMNAPVEGQDSELIDYLERNWNEKRNH